MMSTNLLMLNHVPVFILSNTHRVKYVQCSSDVVESTVFFTCVPDSSGMHGTYFLGELLRTKINVEKCFITGIKFWA